MTTESIPCPPADWHGWKLRPVRSVAVGRCGICDGRLFERFAEGYDYEMGTCPNRWEFRRCTACSHVQLDPRPEDSELPTVYPPTYYSYNMEKRLSSWILYGKSFLDGRRLRRIFRALGRPARTYLDAGCGDGKYLDRMAKEGLVPSDLYGIELDSAAVERARAKGFQVTCATIEACESVPRGEIDVITLFHVIEHLADPAEAVGRLASWLAPGGILAVETPNRDSIDARWFGRTYWGGYHIPRHWHIFTPTGLAKLLEQQGLQVIEQRYVSGHSFWLYSFHHWLRFNSRLPMPRLARFFDPMRSKLPLVLVTGLDYVRAALGFRTSSVLMLARKP